ncbi:MAG: uroporphyrinogen-III C-methyltransferase [Actinomycetota bacterium]
MTVHLVGAGPGDPDLLTLGAATLLGQADCVVHDRLVGPGVLDLVAPWAELIEVGKRGGGPSWRQADIEALLVDRARHHGTVVRLKGGDPFVFGRGGEEAIALRAAGIDVEIVPGVSSAVAAPAAAGVPVTHRHLASGVSIVTAEQDPASDPLDWEALARAGTTLVILMGARRAAAIADRLLGAGLDPATPVAVVTDASLPSQQVRRSSLDRLGRTPVASPSVIVIGAVAAFDVTDLAPLVTGAAA